MTYETFNYLCTQFENSYGLDAGEGWKNIRWIKCDSVSIFDMQALYRKGKIYFIHETNFTGFVIIEENLAETGAIVDKPNYTFLELDCCYSITFEPPKGMEFKSINDLMKSMFDTDLDPSISFEKSTYTFKNGEEASKGIAYLTKNPAVVYFEIYDNEESADADITAASAGTYTPPEHPSIPLCRTTKPGTYYMVAYADYGQDLDEEAEEDEDGNEEIEEVEDVEEEVEEASGYDPTAPRLYDTTKCEITIEE